MHMYFNVNRISSYYNSQIRNVLSIRAPNDGRNKTELLAQSNILCEYINRVVFDEFL